MDTQIKHTIRICLIEDHILVRDGIKLIINQTKNMTIQYEFDCIANFLDEKNKKPIDIILLDLNLPDAQGIESINKIRKKERKKPILILTMHNEAQFGIRAIKAGANGYLTKDNASSELIYAITRIIRGKKYISPDFSDILISANLDKQKGPLHARLSQREFNIMLMLASGKSSTEIGLELDISIKTVSTYRSRLLKKLEITNNTEITRYCLNNNLII